MKHTQGQLNSIFTVRLSSDLMEKLKNRSRETGQSVSEITRDAFEIYFTGTKTVIIPIGCELCSQLTTSHKG